MSDGQVKNYMLVYFSLTRTSLETGQVKILRYLPGGQVNFLRFFYPCCDTIVCKLLWVINVILEHIQLFGDHLNSKSKVPGLQFYACKV